MVALPRGNALSGLAAWFGRRPVVAACGLALAASTLTSCVSLVGWLDQVFGGMPRSYLPARSASAPSGTTFLTRTRSMSADEREDAIYDELASGNMPSHLRQWVAVPVYGRSRSGASHSGEIYVLPDYLAIGSDADFVRIPMTPLTAQRVADLFGATLPTRKMVNDIYRAAEVRLPPRPLPPGPWMTTSDYYLRHARLLRDQIGWRHSEGLMAGHKKDVVITDLLASRPGRVAIYGWHTRVGAPIQPLSLVHPNWYADYSHGIRMVRQGMKVDGRVRLVADVLRDPELSCLVSDEGPFRITRQPGAGEVARVPRALPKLARRL